MRQRGFTLLETLIALVLMSLLMVALFGGFRAGIASWRVADNHIVQAEPQVLVSRMLYRHLSAVHMVQEADFFKLEEALPAVRGTTDRISYTAPLALAVDNQLYSIELANEPGGRAGLWIRYVPYDPALDMQAELEDAEYLQLSGELGMQLSYFVEEDWVDELSEDAVPKLVRVHWMSGERVWPASVFRVTGAGNAQ